LVIISYNHTFDIPENITRRQWYLGQTFSYPKLIVDGVVVPIDVPSYPPESSYYTTYNQHIVSAKSYVPGYNLYLDGTATSSSGNLHIKIVPADTLHRDSVYAFVAVCEDSVLGDLGSRFNFVCRKFYSFPINIVYPDSFTTSINFSHSIPIGKITGVLFVQNLNTKEVLQAIKTKL
jgi:hypothetical protein